MATIRVINPDLCHESYVEKSQFGQIVGTIQPDQSFTLDGQEFYLLKKPSGWTRPSNLADFSKSVRSLCNVQDMELEQELNLSVTDARGQIIELAAPISAQGSTQRTTYRGIYRLTPVPGQSNWHTLSVTLPKSGVGSGAAPNAIHGNLELQLPAGTQLLQITKLSYLPNGTLVGINGMDLQLPRVTLQTTTPPVAVPSSILTRAWLLQTVLNTRHPSFSRILQLVRESGDDKVIIRRAIAGVLFQGEDSIKDELLALWDNPNTPEIQKAQRLTRALRLYAIKQRPKTASPPPPARPPAPAPAVTPGDDPGLSQPPAPAPAAASPPPAARPVPVAAPAQSPAPPATPALQGPKSIDEAGVSLYGKGLYTTKYFSHNVWALNFSSLTTASDVERLVEAAKIDSSIKIGNRHIFLFSEWPSGPRRDDPLLGKPDVTLVNHTDLVTDVAGTMSIVIVDAALAAQLKSAHREGWLQFVVLEPAELVNSPGGYFNFDPQTGRVIKKADASIALTITPDFGEIHNLVSQAIIAGRGKNWDEAIVHLKGLNEKLTQKESDEKSDPRLAHLFRHSFKQLKPVLTRAISADFQRQKGAIDLAITEGRLGEAEHDLNNLKTLKDQFGRAVVTTPRFTITGLDTDKRFEEMTKTVDALEKTIREAQEKKTQAAANAAAAAAAAATARAKGTKDDETTRQAKKHLEDGTNAFQKGRYQEAIEEFKKAYQLKPMTAALYGIARSYKILNDLDNAISYYRQYLAAAPKAPDRSKVEQRLRDLEAGKTVKTAPAAAAPAGSPAVAAPPPPAAKASVATPPPPATPAGGETPKSINAKISAGLATLSGVKSIAVAYDSRPTVMASKFFAVSCPEASLQKVIQAVEGFAYQFVIVYDSRTTKPPQPKTKVEVKIDSPPNDASQFNKETYYILIVPKWLSTGSGDGRALQREINAQMNNDRLTATIRSLNSKK